MTYISNISKTGLLVFKGYCMPATYIFIDMIKHTEYFWQNKPLGVWRQKQ